MNDLSMSGRRWETSNTSALIPGDVFSLTRNKDQDVVPCDCLLMRGSAVLNEATLTGKKRRSFPTYFFFFQFIA